MHGLTCLCTMSPAKRNLSFFFLSREQNSNEQLQYNLNEKREDIRV